MAGVAASKLNIRIKDWRNKLSEKRGAMNRSGIYLGDIPNLKHCPVCGANTIMGLSMKHKVWDLYECSDCEVQFWWPMKHPGGGYYEDMYFSMRDPLRRSYPLYWNHHQFIESPPHDPVGGRSLLDIGCGPGTFLAAARALGYEVYGLDLNPQAIQKSKELYGLDSFFCGTLSNFTAQNPGRRFDVVTSFEVLEHLDDPTDFIDRVRCVLKPDGFVALSVPNRERFMIRRELYDFPPHHLTWWNLSALRTLLSSQGFSPIRLAISPFTLRARVIHNLIDSCSWSLNYRARRVKLNTTASQGHRNSVLGIPSVFANETLKTIVYALLTVPGSILLLWGKIHRAGGGSIYALARRNE